MGFIPKNTPPAEKGAKEPLYFLINDREIAVKNESNRYWIHKESEVLLYNHNLEPSHFIGSWNGHYCYALESQTELPVVNSLEAIPLRDAFTHFSSSGIQAISVAKQIITWDKNYRFCGQCGKPTIEMSGERAKLCKNCGLTNYPRLSPSIIVSVIKDQRILLARSDRFPEGMYSVLAGFVEPGESLEECVQREIVEEVGIEVENIQYFGSQNWPFPHSLMIGFTADYLRGEISIDNDEIVDAGWFSVQELPKLPGSYSIARIMIDHFCNNSLSAD